MRLESVGPSVKNLHGGRGRGESLKFMTRLDVITSLGLFNLIPRVLSGYTRNGTKWQILISGESPNFYKQQCLQN